MEAWTQLGIAGVTLGILFYFMQNWWKQTESREDSNKKREEAREARLLALHEREERRADNVLNAFTDNTEAITEFKGSINGLKDGIKSLEVVVRDGGRGDT